MANDRWRELCKLVEIDDGLPTREVGSWTVDKLWFWHRYIEITTSAMVGNPKWTAGLVYVDLFAGPGICTLRETGDRIPGSALIAAHASKPFEKILVCERDAVLADACETRLLRTTAARRCKVFRGDCNVSVSALAVEIPDRALTIAFVDPTGLHATFDTMRTLTSRGQVDLLVLFADYIDINRNVDQYLSNSESKLDRFLGPESGWRDRWARLTNRDSTNTCKFFADIYMEQLKRFLGYKVFGEKTMSSRQGPLYRLIFASKHERGLEFWNKVTRKDRRRQQDLGF